MAAHALCALEIINREISKFCQLELLRLFMYILQLGFLGISKIECVNAIRDSASFVAEVTNLVPKITLQVLEGKTIQTFRSSKEKEWAIVKPLVGIQSKH
ncbi:hypothetical protein PR048_013047 [Dryococelus australis]|uniref:Uncharacterized protein n=1 Tax=Dryococelus australis TaxID=614101 RepID=A0ABQ9HRD0_9NEOP|nr:hypothetical protein PR048_013047 [Dryococelus australis]